MKSLAEFVDCWNWAGAVTTTSSADDLFDADLKKVFELGKAAVEKALA